MEKFLCKEFYSTDYLFSGSLTLKNGRIDMYQFDEGYCQATQYNATQDNFTFLYYDRDTKPIKIVSGSIIGNKYSWNHSTACCISGISRLTLNEPPSTVLFHTLNLQLVVGQWIPVKMVEK